MSPVTILLTVESQIDNRFTVAIFIRGDISWDEDSIANDNVVVCSFETNATALQSHYTPCRKGYRLHCGDNVVQLYDTSRANTFIFINGQPRKSSSDINVSIALQKISNRVRQVRLHMKGIAYLEKVHSKLAPLIVRQ